MVRLCFMQSQCFAEHVDLEMGASPPARTPGNVSCIPVSQLCSSLGTRVGDAVGGVGLHTFRRVACVSPFISSRVYRISSELRSQAAARSLSTEVGDHSGIVVNGDPSFFFFVSPFFFQFAMLCCRPSCLRCAASNAFDKTKKKQWLCVCFERMWPRRTCCRPLYMPPLIGLAKITPRFNDPTTASRASAGRLSIMASTPRTTAPGSSLPYDTICKQSHPSIVW